MDRSRSSDCSRPPDGPGQGVEEDWAGRWIAVIQCLPMCFAVGAGRAIGGDVEELVYDQGVPIILRAYDAWDHERDCHVKFTTYAMSALKRSLWPSSSSTCDGRRRLRLSLDQVENELSPVDGEFEKLETRDLVQYALRRVGPFHRLVLVATFWKGVARSELALQLGVSRPTATRIVQRALAECRRVLDEEGRRSGDGGGP